jgi:hypothetical protein
MSVSIKIYFQDLPPLKQEQIKKQIEIEMTYNWFADNNLDPEKYGELPEKAIKEIPEMVDNYINCNNNGSIFLI